MAVRIDASGDRLERTSNLPVLTSFTMSCWFYIISITTAYQYFMNLESTDGTSWFTYGFSGDSIFEISTSGGSQSFASMPATGEWHFGAMVGNSGPGAIAYHMTSAGVWQNASPGSVGSFTTGRLSYGNDTVDEWTDCRIAAMKVWDASLTLAELEKEAWTTRPSRFANIHLWVPGFPGSGERTRDYSGNGYNLTEQGTLTDEDPPPVSWGASPLFHIVLGGDYTRGNYAALPTDDADLETVYTAQDITDVASNNNVRVSQLATGEYAIHQYKNSVAGATGVTLTWEGQTDFSPSSSTVYLQIYNRNSTTWETVDSDNTTAANTDFTLTANITDVTNYINGVNKISCRIYQQSV